jgi:hypothetical protein
VDVRHNLEVISPGAGLPRTPLFVLAVAVIAICAGCSSASSTASSAPIHVSPADLQRLLRSAPKVGTYDSVTLRSGTSPQSDARIAGTYDLQNGAVHQQTDRRNPAVRVETITVGNTYYGRTKSGEWVEIKRPRNLWGDLSPQAPGEANIPSIAKATSIVNLGEVTVNGQSTAHYRASEPISTFFALAQAAMPRQPLAKGQRRERPSAFTGTITTDLYLDPEGRIVRVDHTEVVRGPADLVPPGQSRKITWKTTTSYSDYNEAAPVQQPPTSQIATVTVAKTVSQYERQSAAAG